MCSRSNRVDRNRVVHLKGHSNGRVDLTPSHVHFVHSDHCHRVVTLTRLDFVEPPSPASGRGERQLNQSAVAMLVFLARAAGAGLVAADLAPGRGIAGIARTGAGGGLGREIRRGEARVEVFERRLFR